MIRIKLTIFDRMSIKLTRTFGRLMSTFIALIKYRRHLEIGNRAFIEGGFRAKQQLDGEYRLYISMGDNSFFLETLVQGSGILTLGSNSYVDQGCVIGVNESITIG